MEITGPRKFYRSCSARSSTKPVVNLPKSSYSSPTPPPHRSPMWEGGANFEASYDSPIVSSPKLSLSSPTETERCLSEYINPAPRSPRSPRSPLGHNNVSPLAKSSTIFQFGPQSPKNDKDQFDVDNTSGVKHSMPRNMHTRIRNANDNKPYHSLDSDTQTVSTSLGSTTTTSLSSRHSSLKEKRGRRRQLPSPNDSSNSTPTEKPKISRCRKSTSDLTDLADDANNTTSTPLSRSGSRKSSKGGLAYLASRRSSRGSRESISSVLSNASNEGIGPLNFQHPRNRQRRTSNFLELPVPDHIRPRVCSLPEKTINPRLSDDLYRLRTFSITNKGVVNCGDSIINRRSRSNTSVNSITSRSNVSGERSPFDGSCCGSGYHSVGSDSFDSVNETEIPKYRVVTLGDAGVGKTALVSQFMTSEYMNTYDASLDDEFGERTVSILLDGQESEMVFIDHPASEMSVENCMSTYEPHACIVVYSITSKSTFQTAEEILNYLWKENYTKEKTVIVVGNKADLARARVITQNEGKGLAVAKDCKFIETSSGIQHNVDELLVGILKQIRLRESLQKKKSMTKEKNKMKGSKTSLRLHFAKEILQKICLNDISKSKSCENLHVL
ncbi:uncharacterized protein LOC126738483 isoform X2 [Anthonomus grandis grandis]|uniref:uncharacterized protein LOC126738483 isoform X2 n=1 Tax=Anthonomus grandis grandis TaxID=2921223 RepID=UPI002165F70E|nr:uncharacterized protein LOC126738483 isoform X2 [Anthonomus grandis grandis]